MRKNLILNLTVFCLFCFLFTAQSFGAVIKNSSNQSLSLFFSTTSRAITIYQGQTAEISDEEFQNAILNKYISEGKIAVITPPQEVIEPEIVQTPEVLAPVDEEKEEQNQEIQNVETQQPQAETEEQNQNHKASE